MNLTLLLAMPWAGLRTSLRRVWVLFSLACLGGALALFLERPGFMHQAWSVATMLLAFWLAMMGLLLSSLLLPALEARQLSLPRLQRAAALSLLLNVVLVLVAVAPMVWLSGHPRVAGQVLLLGLAAGFAYALLPALWILPLLLLLMLPFWHSVGHLWHWRMIGPNDPRFIWVTTAVIVLAGLGCAWCWRRLLRYGVQPIGWRMRPTILNFHLSARRMTGDPQVLLACQTPSWLLPQVRMDAAGPGHFPRTLRIALGGVFLPVTVRSAARQLLLPGLLVLITFVPLLASKGAEHDANLRATVLSFAGMGIGLLILALMLTRSAQLFYRWRRPDGALALLSLLPGLGTGAAQTTRLLETLFGWMCAWTAPLIGISVLAVMVATHSLDLAVLQLIVLGLVPAAEVAAVYSTLGRRPLPSWALAVLAVLGMGLFIAGDDLLAFGGRAVLSGSLATFLLVGCGLGYAMSVLLAVRGRSALRHQPHPYLALE